MCIGTWEGMLPLVVLSLGNIQAAVTRVAWGERKSDKGLNGEELVNLGCHQVPLGHLHTYLGG